MEIEEFEWDDNNIEHIARHRVSPDEIEEAARRFWEKHSIADYWDDLKECDDTFKRPALKPVTLKFDPIMLKKIKMLARKRGVSYNAYIRYLLIIMRSNKR